MNNQGYKLLQQKKKFLFSNKNLRAILKLPLALSTLLIISGGTLSLSPISVNAENTSQKVGLSLLIAQAPTNQNIIYVNPETGNDTEGAGTAEASAYKTITFALQKAQPGTVIQLAPGIYTSETGETFPLEIKSGITLKGDESSKGQAFVITGSGEYVSRTFARQNITILAGENATISGVTVTNTERRGTGVWVESTNPIIQNNTFINNKREGVFVTGTGNPKIENNVFSQNSGNGVSVAKSAQGEIRNNVFQNTGFGLAIGGTSSPLLAENRIIENIDGIFISNSAKPKLRKNVIENNQRDGIIVISNGLPDLGTNEEPGENFIRNNKRNDLNNATRGTIIAIGNDIDADKIAGQVEFVAAKVDKPAGEATAFSDVTTGYWAKNYIEALSAQGAIAGFPDGTYKPDEPVTRAQFAAIINKAFSPQAKRTTTSFRDVNRNFWGWEAIQTAYKGGFLAGYPGQIFKPQQQIPRVQVLVSLANGLELSASDQSSLSFYSDASQIPNYAKGPVSAATIKELVVNYPTLQKLNPNRQATRAEVAAFVYQALVNAGRAQALPSPYLVKVSN
ncbi:MAG: DUF1565 domain-containing protein [Cyanobacteria bacterium P01_A01_bin.84]